MAWFHSYFFLINTGIYHKWVEAILSFLFGGIVELDICFIGAQLGSLVLILNMLNKNFIVFSFIFKSFNHLVCLLCRVSKGIIIFTLNNVDTAEKRLVDNGSCNIEDEHF